MYGDKKSLIIYVIRAMIIFIVLAGIVVLIVATVRIATKDNNSGSPEQTTSEQVQQDQSGESVNEQQPATPAPSETTQVEQTPQNEITSQPQQPQQAEEQVAQTETTQSQPVTGGGEDLPETGNNTFALLFMILASIASLYYLRSKKNLLETLGSTRINK
ncbi:LPXTG cell wall anchor domain-containing protein [Candidatus Saccharibacteria bacterium CPR2]|nr:LPXTG cell wall anchor domain-containing protein [Candidatus Saccharibacteria bacterium CPR2]